MRWGGPKVEPRFSDMKDNKGKGTKDVLAWRLYNKTNNGGHLRPHLLRFSRELPGRDQFACYQNVLFQWATLER